MNTVIPPPIVVAIIGLLMWGTKETLRVGQIKSELQLPITLILVAIGLLLMVIAVGHFVAARTTINPLRPANATTLITTGVFAISRNPIYLGDLLILAALAVWLGNMLNIALPALFVWYINRFQIAPEERALREKFGAAYDAYCSRVRRWL